MFWLLFSFGNIYHSTTAYFLTHPLYIYMSPKSKIESKAHYAPEPARDLLTDVESFYRNYLSLALANFSAAYLDIH